MAKSKVVVKINGAEYALKGDKSEDQLFSIANFVDKKVKEILGSNPKHSNTSAAVLSALMIADEVFNNRQDIEIYKRKLVELEGKELQARTELDKIQNEYSKLVGEYNSVERTQQVSRENVDTLRNEYETICSKYGNINEEYKKFLSQNEILKKQNDEYEIQLIKNEDMMEDLKSQLLDSKIELVRVTKDFKDYKDIQNRRRNV